MARPTARAVDRLRPAAVAVLSILLVLGTGACALGGRSYGPGLADGEPLDVWIESPDFDIGSPFPYFHISQPAYVAVFDFRPGVGVSTVYPYIDTAEPRLFHAGYNTLLPAARASLASSSGIGPGCSTLASPVVYRFIVASTRPLTLSRLRGRVGFTYRPALRRIEFSIGPPGQIMREVASAIVPGYGPGAGGGADWNAYYTAYWSPVGCRTRIASLPWVRLFDVASDDRPGDGADRDVPGRDDPGDEATGPRPPVVGDLPDDRLRDGDPVLRPEAPERGRPAAGADAASGAGSPPRTPAVYVRDRDAATSGGLRDRVLAGEVTGRIGPASIADRDASRAANGRDGRHGGDGFDARSPRIRHRPVRPARLRDRGTPAHRLPSRLRGGRGFDRPGTAGRRAPDLDRPRIRSLPSRPARLRGASSSPRARKPSRPE